MKKKTKLLSLISTTLAGLALSLGVVGVVSYKEKSTEASAYYTPSTHYEVSDTASELASYYSSISDSDSGTSLLSKLQSLNSSKRKKTMGYSTIGTDTSGAVIYTDYDLNNTAKDSNGQTYGTKVASFYTKTSATSWNREHMWPNSHGGNNVEADILHTRPTISSENSSRGNSFYVEGQNSSTSGWDPYTAGYAEWCRGECARVILYCVVAYPSFTLSDADSHSTSNSNKDNMMGNMNTLIKWHFNYLPNVYEKNRNDGAEYLQGNRNPFVDHPEYVARIWSNFNSTVSSLCSSNSSTYSNWVPGNYCNFGSNTPVAAAEGVSISASTASVSVGSTTTLSATSTDSGAITWTTSNSSVASISSSSSASGANITITGVAAGTATITAKRTINGTQYSQTCTVTVTKVVSSLSKGSTSPTKTTYTAGESFDPTGLTITANYSDSTSSNVTSSVVWSPDPLTAGTTSVTGTFGGKTITISGLTVNAATEPEIIDSNSDLSVGDYVVLRTEAGVGVTGWNNNKDATVSETESEWKKFYVASASSSGFTLKDESANNFIANPGSSNQFIYGSAATCSTDSSGHLICNSRYLCKNGTNYRFYTSIGSYLPFFIYKVPGSGGSTSTKTLSSISIDGYTTQFTVDDTFVFGGTVTANFSDSTSSNVTSSATFSGYNMTVAGNYTVTVSYTYEGTTKTQTYQITVSSSGGGQTISSITASVSKTYYVGETISSSDITVEDNNGDEVEGFSFANDGYAFTYNDAVSGGALTNKTFNNSISYNALTCSLIVQVQRKAYATPTGGSTLEHTGAEFKTAGIATGSSSSYKENQTATVDGVTFNVSGYVYNNTYLSFSTSSSKAPGSLISTTPYPSGITNVTINGASPDIQLSTDGDTWVDFASASTSATNYYYLKVYFKNTSQSGYINISSISVTLKASETAENVSNYIMYEDTNNQCVSKLSIAMSYFGNLTSSGKSTFASSDDFVIKSARERLEAWAANQGKTINYSTGELTNKAGVVQYGVGQENSSTTIIIIVSAMSVVSLSVLLIIKKKRLHN